MTKIEWDNLYKIRIASSQASMAKHETVKLLLVMRILEKHRKNRFWVRVYTEMDLGNNCRCDVYYENMKKKEVIAFEIQKDYSKEWLQKKGEQYKDWTVPFMNTADWIPINLNEMPDNIGQIWEKLGRYV